MLPSAIIPRDAEQELARLQQLSPHKRGSAFDAVFFRQLQVVTTRIHATETVDEILLELGADISRLFNADRVTLYAASEQQGALVAKVKTGLNTSRELKTSISTNSIAGYVALSGELVNIADAHDDAALQRIHPGLVFPKDLDQRAGYRTRQMLVAPIMENDLLRGVLQVINNRSDVPFGSLEVEGITQLCQTLATAIGQRMKRAQETARRPVTKYDGLVADGVMTQDELQAAVSRARGESLPVEQVLAQDYSIRPAQIGASLAKFFGVPYEPSNPSRLPIKSLHSALKPEFVMEQGWIPLEEGPEGLVVMCLDPEAVRGSRIVPQVLPRAPAKLAWRVTTQADFGQTLNQLWGSRGQDPSVEKLLADLTVPLEEEETSAEGNALESAAADNELVKFVNKVIADAYEQRASDIHIEPLPGKGKTGIRFRIDGSLVPYVEVPSHFRQALVTRLKIMCDLDISERRKPQDGKIKFRKYGPLDIELRVATIPSAGGVEDVVMRILAAGEPIPLDRLGLTEHTRESLQHVVSKPYGLFYVCGPTGSGKTTTLHSVMKFLNTPETKIWTAEDPVEITQKGLRQVQVNRKAGIDFAMVMRAFLRADPDIIMVGESRDKETVGMGIEASLTGHLVLSTLHTNSAPESITRLVDMGMDPFSFSDALLGVLAQRLARRLCDCKESYLPAAEELQAFADEYTLDLKETDAWRVDPEGEMEKLLDSWAQAYGSEGRVRLHRAVGCDKCNHTGYKGRIGLHELLVADDEIKRLVQERARVSAIFVAAVAGGMRTLKMDGMEKIMMGLTDLKQVRSICTR